MPSVCYSRCRSVLTDSKTTSAAAYRRVAWSLLDLLFPASHKTSPLLLPYPRPPARSLHNPGALTIPAPPSPAPVLLSLPSISPPLAGRSLDARGTSHPRPSPTADALRPSSALSSPHTA